eukprot:TRINITY_DN10178_c0_g1_i1.p1 TRINITY_DN10178_c0_g1~~TRINITY_DN10178_c0_g1_i1.p1  ORF type:complete len:401 (+),score=128.51 TRINITY_DN10178_c0_g1_i1:236-1438(+)
MLKLLTILSFLVFIAITIGDDTVAKSCSDATDCDSCLKVEVGCGFCEGSYFDKEKNTDVYWFQCHTIEEDTTKSTPESGSAFCKREEGTWYVEICPSDDEKSTSNNEKPTAGDEKPTDGDEKPTDGEKPKNCRDFDHNCQACAEYEHCGFCHGEWTDEKEIVHKWSECRFVDASADAESDEMGADFCKREEGTWIVDDDSCPFSCDNQHECDDCLKYEICGWCIGKYEDEEGKVHEYQKCRALDEYECAGDMLSVNKESTCPAHDDEDDEDDENPEKPSDIEGSISIEGADLSGLDKDELEDALLEFVADSLGIEADEIDIEVDIDDNGNIKVEFKIDGEAASDAEVEQDGIADALENSELSQDIKDLGVDSISVETIGDETAGTSVVVATLASLLFIFY